MEQFDTDNSQDALYPSRKRHSVQASEIPAFYRLLALLRLYLPTLLLIFAVVSVIVTYDHYVKPVYRAKASLLVQRAENSPLQALMAKVTANPMLSDRRSNEYLEKYLFYLNSREFFVSVSRKILSEKKCPPEILSRVEQELGRGPSFLSRLIYSKVTNVSSLEDDIERLAKTLKSTIKLSKGGTDSIIVVAKSRDPKYSVVLANFISQEAVDKLTANELKELNDAKQFITSQVTLAGNRIKGIDSDIVTFRRGNDLTKTEETSRDLGSRVSRLQSSLQEVEIKKRLNDKMIAILDGEVKMDEDRPSSLTAEQLKSKEVVLRLRRNLMDLKIKKTMLSAQGYSEASPEVTNLNAQLNQIRDRLKASIEALGGAKEDYESVVYDKQSLADTINKLKIENQYLSASAESIHQAIREASAPLDRIPETQQQLTSLHREANVEYFLLQQLRQRNLEIELETIALNTKIRVLEPATMASILDRFNVIPKLMFALLIVLFVSGIIIYVLEELNHTVRRRSEIEAMDVHFIGTIPAVNLRAGPKALLDEVLGRKQAVTNILNLWKREHEQADTLAFKHIRNSVLKMKSQKGQPAKVISILGPRQGDGKSFVSCNLALSLAQLGKKTLLIDGDLRKSTVKEKLGLPAHPGLSDVLSKKASFDSVIQKDVFSGLDVITAGPLVSGASELLSSLFADVLERIKQDYEYVILDTPAVLPVVDSLVISNLSDSIVLVVAHRRTRLIDIDQAIQKIRQVDSKPIYAVYNRVAAVGEYVYITNNYVGGDGNSSSKNPRLMKDIEKFRESLQVPGLSRGHENA